MNSLISKSRSLHFNTEGTLVVVNGKEITFIAVDEQTIGIFDKSGSGLL